MSSSSSTSEIDPKQPKSYRILVVEDHVGSAKILAILFRKYGQLDIELAHSGEDALEIANSFRPEIVVLDLILGEMSGLDVCKSLRQSEKFNGTLIVALSGNSSPEDRQETETAGFNLHLAKPVSVDDIQRILAVRHEM